MKGKDTQGRETRKRPAPEPINPIREAREAARFNAVLRESDDAYAAYYATLSPRDQERMPRP